MAAIGKLRPGQIERARMLLQNLPEKDDRKTREEAAGILEKDFRKALKQGYTPREHSWSCFMRQVCGKNKMERFVVYAAFLSSPFRGSGPLWRWMPLYTSSGV